MSRILNEEIPDQELKSNEVSFLKNGKVGIRLMLSSSYNGHTPYAYMEVNKYDKFIHIPHFDSQVSGNEEERHVKISPRSECSESIKSFCFQFANEDNIEDKEHEYFSSLLQRGRCDDIIIFNQTAYLLEMKTREFLPYCKAFQQLITTKKILVEKILQNFDKKEIPYMENITSYKLILCISNDCLIFIQENDAMINPNQPILNFEEQIQNNVNNEYLCNGEHIHITSDELIIIPNTRL